MNDSDDHARELGALLRGMSGWDDEEGAGGEQGGARGGPASAASRDVSPPPAAGGEDGEGEERWEEAEEVLCEDPAKDLGAPGPPPPGRPPRRALQRGPIASLNLIPYNPGPSAASPYSAPSHDRVVAFQRLLRTEFRLRTSVRVPMGQDIWGACGQLALSLHASTPSEPADIEDLG